MRDDQIATALRLFERYVVVQEGNYALSRARIEDMKSEAKRVAELDERNAAVREREAKAAEIQAVRKIEFTGQVQGDVNQRVTYPASPPSGDGNRQASLDGSTETGGKDG